MKTAVVTGASGFVGINFLHELIHRGIMVYAIVRPGSPHRNRLDNLSNVKVIELSLQNISKLPERICAPCDVFYHLGWECTERDFISQNLNIQYTLEALEAACRLGCRRFVGIGSQAEYGIYNGLITEEINPKPNTSYGAAKLAACHLSRVRADELQLEWVWARLFSIYGPYDGGGTLISYLMQALHKSEIPKMGKAAHLWNFLHATDAARALYSLGLTDYTNEIYNIGSEDIRPLKSFAEALRLYVAPQLEIEYKEAGKAAVPLSVSVDKLKRYTNWRQEVAFDKGIEDTYKHLFG